MTGGTAAADAANLATPTAVCPGCLETALSFHCAADQLLGVLSLPEGPCSETAVLIVVGGPQYRAGSHRQFVLSARRLAAAGFATLRFDVRGMGDSEGEARSFEALDDDVACAAAALRQRLPAVRRLVLLGLCDGASAALLYLLSREDRGVGGLVLLNPWVRSVQTQAATQVKHYYGARLRSAAFWRKLLSGGVAVSAAKELGANVSTLLRARLKLGAGGRSPHTPADLAGIPGPSLPFHERMAAAWAQFQAPILLLLSGDDQTAREFCVAVASTPAWRGALERPNVTRHDLPGADHTMSDAAAGAAADQKIVDWLRAMRPVSPSSA